MDIDRVCIAMDASKQKYMDAVALVLRDQDGMYDECLVDRLLELHQADRSRATSELVLDAICDWYNDESTTDLNHSRVFKLQGINSLTHKYPSTDTRAVELMWARIPKVVTRNNTSEISSCLQLLNRLVSKKVDFLTLIEKQFHDFFIRDIAQLANHYIETSKSYHIQEHARYLFVTLMGMTIVNSVPSHHPSFISTKRIIEQSLESNSKNMFQTLTSLLNTGYNYEIYDLKSLLKRCFDNSQRDENNRIDINDLCRCLAVARVPSKYVIEKLKKSNNFDAILTYVINYYDSIFDHTSMRYLAVYPILVHCDSEDANVLASRLNMIRDEEYFVERFASEKHVTRCLSYMRKSFAGKINSINGHLAALNQRRYSLYFMNVILEYIKCNYKAMMAYKNILECCAILFNAIEYLMRKSRIAWLFQLIETFLNIMEPYDDSISCTEQAILIQMIRLVGRSHRKTTVFQSQKFVSRVHANFMRYIRLARRFKNLDILNEFTALFMRCDFQFDIDDDESRAYIELVYGYMYSTAKEHAFHDLYGNVVSLFCYIDFSCPEWLLKEFGLEKHSSVPKIMKAILTNPTTDEVTIEAIFRAIKAPYCVTPESRANNYLVSIYKASKRENLEDLIEGICLALLRDLSTSTHLPMVRILLNIMDIFVRTMYKDPTLLRTLIRTRILETLYNIHECSSYEIDARREICHTMSISKEELIRILPATQERAIELVSSLITEVEPDDKTRYKCAEALVRFVIIHSDKSCMLYSASHVGPFKANIVGGDTYVDNILNQETSSRGTLECY